jgi:hypothetical protein
VTAEIEKRVAQALSTLGAAYELIPIDPAYADTAAFCDQYGFPLDRAGNTIIVASKKDPSSTAPAWSKPRRASTSTTP